MKEEIIIERGCVHCSLCDEDEECYLNRCKRIEQENKQMKSVLEEIREIAKDIIKNDVYENSDAKAEKILTKINEVLNDDRE